MGILRRVSGVRVNGLKALGQFLGVRRLGCRLDRGSLSSAGGDGLIDDPNDRCLEF